MVSPKSPRLVGRYLVHDLIAAGGMATVHLGRYVGSERFSRTVAVKQLHGQFARDRDFVAMLLDEARLLARIRHSNVVAPVDVVLSDDELFIVMEYVHAESLARLFRDSDGPVPPRIACGIMSQTLLGLHAAHEAVDERSRSLDIVHRDVSPQNILVAPDGSVKLVDFGIAKAAWRSQTTHEGQLKGKRSYMAPEQFRGERVDRRTDLFAAGAVLWEMLTGMRLFSADAPALVEQKVLAAAVDPPSEVTDGIPEALDRVVLKALARDPAERFDTARDFVMAMDRAMPTANALEIGNWVDALAGPSLAARAARIAEFESVSVEELTEPMPSEKRASLTEPVRSDFRDTSLLADTTARDRPPLREQPSKRERRVLGLLAASVAVAAAIAAFFMLDVAGQKAPSLSAAATEGASNESGRNAPSTEVSATNALSSPAPPMAASELPTGALAGEPRAGGHAGEASSKTRVARAMAPRHTTNGAGSDDSSHQPARDRVPSGAATETTTGAEPRGASSRTEPADAPAAESRSARCDPPYVVDDRGIKRFILDCVKTRPE